MTGNSSRRKLDTTLIAAVVPGLLAACDLAPPLPPSLAAVTAGAFHTCALDAAGTPACWGDNSSGQAGDATTEFVSTPAQIPTDRPFVALASGESHNCALDEIGSAYCWGSNGAGRLGVSGGPRDTPVPVRGGMTFTIIVAGGAHSCGVTADSIAYCWGSNGSGQLGTRALTGDCNGTCSTTPVRVEGTLRFTHLAAGGAHTCGITPSGAAYCWGANAAGQLGSGYFDATPLPVLVSGGHRFRAISAGAAFTCALRMDGLPFCWGLNDRGQLGAETPQVSCQLANTSCSARPVAVQTTVRFRRIATGTQHACGLSDEGVALCWGGNSSGQLGNGAVFARSVPQFVQGNLRFTAIAAGAEHTCALSVEATVYCWGDNFRFQLGNGGNGLRSPSPIAVFAAQGS